MIDIIAPPGIIATDVFGEHFEAELLPEEARALGRVCEVRRRDFTGGRSCSRRALQYLGIPAQPILPGENREPIWPDGVVGSITHCPGYCAAAVGPAAQFASVGIDAEVYAPLPDGVLRMIASDDERAWMHELSGRGVCWDRLIFSAKESIYKAWFPVTRRWLGFHDVKVTVDPVESTFRGQVLVRDLPDTWAAGVVEGRYLATATLIVTLVVTRRVSSDEHQWGPCGRSP